MKTLILLLTCITLSLPAHAQNLRLEDAVEQTYKDLLENKFEIVEERLNEYMAENAKTRHGTDKTMDVIQHVLKRVDVSQNHKKWNIVEQEWRKHSPNSYIQKFFNQQYNHAEALYFINNAEQNKLLQSHKRKYKDTMGNSYNRYLKIINKHPDKWRTHAYLAANFARYKLTAKELETHLQAAQQLNKNEISSITGYVTSLSPHALGRTDKMISKAIESILKKHPDKNLTKPEYLDDAIKKEIEDQIFEFTIGRMLLTARQYVEETPDDSTAPSLIPATYQVIFKDLETYYGADSQKIKDHPLSYKRKAVWNEIEEQYKQLAKRFPNSGKYLGSYLELTLDQGRLDAAKTIISTLQKNDPNYAPERISPLQCDYFTRLKGNQRGKNANARMYEACKKAARYNHEKTFHYRAGWAARQIGNFEESNAYLAKASKLDPKNATYLTDICWNFIDLKRYDKALDYCDKAIAQNRSHARAWLGRSHINFYGFNNVAQSQKDAQVYKTLTEKN